MRTVTYVSEHLLPISQVYTKNVARGASRGDSADNKDRAPEGRKKFKLDFFRPSGAFDSLVNFVPMTYVMGYILSPLRGF
jgi:hypothetical protein